MLSQANAFALFGKLPFQGEKGTKGCSGWCHDPKARAGRGQDPKPIPERGLRGV